ncbi:MAG: hypothetical protein J0M04_11480 [Verrucomicrobia bacterium]|nr:hypothetical protein [Verrucomicrobiota bacterium]
MIPTARRSLLSLVLLASFPVASAAEPSPVTGYHLTWDSPSKDCHGSMPLGNGDISLNAWIEPSGDLCFYIGKTDAWDDNARLVKLGKVRVKLDPAPPVSPFKQELALAEGMMKVSYGDGTVLRLWADANRPVIHVEAVSNKPTKATAVLEPWRTKRETLASIECSDVMNKAPAGEAAPTVVEPDVFLSNQKDRIGWYHHNIKSVGPSAHARIQGVTGFEREDPLLHRTFGAVVTATRPERADDLTLRSGSGTAHRFDIHVLTLHPATPEQWLAKIDGQVTSTDAIDFAARLDAHRQWWHVFWNRSWIQAKSNTPPAAAPANNHKLRTGVDQGGGNKLAGEIRGVSESGDPGAEFSLTAEVKPNPGATGRIFDKITPGGSDGYLLDLQPGNQLRLIIGSEQFFAKDVLPAGRWSKVIVLASASGWRVSVDGKEVIATGKGGPAMDDASYLSQMFALQRFVTACAGRGAYPIKFNGSIFTVPYPGGPGDADYRKWGPGYWWQNTRLPYLSACANGDTEFLEPLFRMYADRILPLNIYRTKGYFGIENAAYFAECIHFWGDVFNETYGWTPVEKRKDPLQESGWHKWEWVAGPELVWMMIEAYEHTGDKALLEKRIIPAADAVIRFFDSYYKTGADGQLVMHPSQACETWWDCTNPMPELAGLQAITAKLLDLPEGAVPADKRAYWKTFAAKLAPLPVRDTPDGKALAPATRFAAKSNCENPELYAVFPFRRCSFEKDNRELGVNALKHRWDRGNSGWRQDDIFMAYLGLTDEARQSIVARSRTTDKGSRFPAFWGPNYDWIPDQDHGGVLMKTTQAMLMQCDGDRIHLLPAWPKEWDVKFKLHAPKRTTVECEVKGGRITRLTVTPEARRRDVTIRPPFQP